MRSHWEAMASMDIKALSKEQLRNLLENAAPTP
jgi:hypothetical protein